MNQSSEMYQLYESELLTVRPTKNMLRQLLQTSEPDQNKGVLSSRLPTERCNVGVHVNVVLPVEVAVLLPADAAQQEAVCKREGDVRDRDEQQDKGKHCGILTTKVDATETERKEDLGRPRYESGHDKG